MNTKTVLAGNLNFMNLGDVLQLLGANGSTGILRIRSKYAVDPGLIYISNGNPIQSIAGDLTGLNAIYTLFGWTEGEFEFNREIPSCETVIKKDRMAIILDGLRMLDDGHIEKLGPLSFRKAATGPLEGEISLPVIRGPLVDYMYVVEEETYDDGKEIVREGRHGSWIWVILEGSVDIVKETPRGPLRILRIGEGSFVGNIASLITGGGVRAVTTIAHGKVQLGVLDAQRLYSEFGRMSPEFRGVLLSIDKRLRQVTNRAVAIYLKNKLDEFVSDRTLVIQQGENSERSLSTITQGEAYVVRHTSDNDDVPLINLSQGDFIGPLPFVNIGHEPHSASIYGSHTLKLAPLDASRLHAEYDEHSLTVRNMIDNVSACVSATTIAACEFQKKLWQTNSDEV
jgi:CRP-like cAMP-binding protein